METLVFILLIIPIAFGLHFIRFKLTRWEQFVLHFKSEKRPELNPIYGFWSEFRQSPKSYPLSNSLLKVATTSFGLYLQYDLMFEPIKYYKPVMIPWGNINIAHSEAGAGKGCHEYIITKNGGHLGSIFIQIPISDQIVNESKNLGIEVKVTTDKVCTD